MDLTTDTNFDAPLPKAGLVDEGCRVQFTDWTRADRCKRQIIEAIQSCETVAEIDDYIRAESIVLDGLYLFDPAMTEEVRAVATECRAWVRSSVTLPSPAAPGTPTKRKTAMAANPDFKKHVVKDVALLWPRLDRPYRYNNAQKRTEPCDPHVTGAGYSIAWEMPNADAKALWQMAKDHYADCQTRQPKLPAFGGVFGMKKDGEKPVTRFTAKRKAVSNAGNENKPPKVVGLDLNPLADPAIWTGSKGSVRIQMFPTTDPDGKGGISFIFDVVQVSEAVYGDDNLEDDFGPAKTLDDFDDEAESGVAAARKAPAPADLDDEVAF